MTPRIPADASLLQAIAGHEGGARLKQQGFIITEAGKTLDDELGKAQITTPLRMAHFLAQIFYEADDLTTTEERASGAEYEGRADLGNTSPGDGRLYKGRGLIMLTGKANYMAVGQRLGLDLVRSPDLAATPQVALAIACDYWIVHALNALADRDNLVQITRVINGGLNGLSDRNTYLARAKAAVAQRVAAGLAHGAWPVLHRGMSGPDVVELQETLQARGVLLAVDGVFGAGTEAAVRQWQATHSLAADGIAGPSTWTSLAPSVPAA
jgi:putative chitinase